ncbi:MAG: transposase [Hyphomonas sp.]|nr:transposase [Hyphomonas sp.]MCC0017596.1 transposase [Rhodobiaceae bacterium]
MRGLKQIAAFYAIEAEIRGLTPEVRRPVRQVSIAPLVAACGEWPKQKRSRISAKARLGEKFTYRQPVGGAAGVSRRRPCREGQQ